MLDTLSYGIYLPWKSIPPRVHSKGYAVAPKDMHFLEKELSHGQVAGFYRELTPEAAAQAHCVFGAFVLTSAGTQRLVIDYRVPNAHQADTRFKYESFFYIRRSCGRATPC